MLAVRIPEPGAIEVVRLQAPVAGDGEVVVDVAYAGICGSDVEVYAGRRPRELVHYPVVPGHEWSGTVASVGDGVNTDLIGRKVVGEGFRSCATCLDCLRGDSTLCATYHETGFTAAGAWAEQLSLPARLLHVLSDVADLRSAAGLEPAACAADAVRRAGDLQGAHIAVLGAGTIGQLTAQLARIARPASLLVVEPDSRRAEQALRNGADTALSPAEAVERSQRFDVVIEASGTAPAAQLATQLARRGGRVVLTGMFEADALLSARDLVSKRLVIETVFGAPSDAWLAALRAFDAGLLDPGALVTHEFELTAVGAALDLVAERAPGVGKVLLRL